MSLVGFITDCARNLGSPGIRFLQLLGQYTTLPPEYTTEFQKVYDTLLGQSKLTAHQTVQREFPNFRDHYSGLEAAIGGGSITTVYRTTTTQGENRVIKVINPNLRHLNAIAFDVVREALKDVAAEDPRYALGEEIIDEIKEWVDRDITFEGFLEKDKIFRAKNAGFKGPNGYSIHVPTSYGPANKYFKIEDFVPGKNFTQHQTLSEEGHDLKAIVSTLAKNYLYQMRNGLIHSDVHPGNFRITPDKRIAILDRNFYLESDASSRAFYTALLSGAMMNNNAQVADSLAQHLNLPRDSALYAGLTAAVRDELASAKPLTDKLLGVVKYIKSQHVKIPLETTLLIRNIHALQKFSETAGFTSLSEALFYT